MTLRFVFFYALIWFNKYGWFKFSLFLIGSSLIIIEGLTLKDRDNGTKYTTSLVALGAIIFLWNLIELILPAVSYSSLTNAESIIFFSYFTSVAIIGNSIYILLGVTFIAFSYKNKFSWRKLLGISGIILAVSYIINLIDDIIIWHTFLFNSSEYSNYYTILRVLVISMVVFVIVSMGMLLIYTLKNRRFFLSSFSVIQIIILIFNLLSYSTNFSIY